MVQVTLADAIDKTLQSFFDRIQENIPALFVPSLFLYQITSADKIFFENSINLRKFIRGIVEKRKQGIAGGLAVGEEKDIISILVNDDIYSNLEDVVDDVIVMFIAGTKTV